jgi:hypothetical protein
MPAATHYTTDPNSKEAQVGEAAFVKEMAARGRGLAQAWRYYDGDMARPLRPDKTRVDDNVIINLVELLVEKGVSNLFGSDEVGEVEGVEFQIVPRAPSPLPSLGRGEGAALPGGGRGEGLVTRLVQGGLRALGLDALHAEQRWLDSFWRANKKNLLLHDLGLNGGLAGHVFVKLMPGRPYPRLVNLNPAHVAVFWDENDMDRALWYRIQYAGQTGAHRQDIVRAEDAPPPGGGGGGAGDRPSAFPPPFNAGGWPPRRG